MAGQDDTPMRGGNDAPGGLEAHPVGCALRTAVLRMLLKLARAFQQNEAATHTSRRSWRNTVTHWRTLSFGPDLDTHSHKQGAPARGFLAYRETAEAQDRWVFETLMSGRCGEKKALQVG